MGVRFLLVTVLAFGAWSVVSCEKNVLCYYGTWATYRSGNSKFDVAHVNTALCSHLVYAFVGIDSQGTVISLDPYLDLPDNWGRDNFGQLNALKQKNPKLKTLLAVGGWNEGSAKYSIMAANANLRKNFITSALNMVQTHGFDGFDLDWEYPSRRDSAFGSADINNFSQLVKEIKEEFGKHGLLVTAAVSSVGEMASLSYDIATICQHLDLVNLMTYDFYGAWDSVTGHNAALHKGEGDGATPRESLYTVDVAVEYWLANGCSPAKLVIGLPVYGRTFTLADANVNGVRAPTVGAGIAGASTQEPGNVGYNDFCNLLQTESGWEVRLDEEAKVPYAFQGRNWVTYDNTNSITKKVEWGLERNISNYMIWSIETDDFNGICGEDFPILRAINRALGRIDNDSEDATTAAPTTVTEVKLTTATDSDATTEAEIELTTKDVSPPESTAMPETEPTTVDPKSTAMPESKPTTGNPSNTDTDAPPDTEDLNAVCQTEGIVANPYNCSQFLMCVRDNQGQLFAIVFHCPENTQYDASIYGCNYEYIVRCGM